MVIDASRSIWGGDRSCRETMEPRYLSRKDWQLPRFFFFFQAEDGIRDLTVTGVQTCALPISLRRELKLYNPELAKKPYAVAATKLDIAGEGKNLKKLETDCKKRHLRLFPISEIGRASCRERV